MKSNTETTAKGLKSTLRLGVTLYFLSLLKII